MKRPQLMKVHSILAAFILPVTVMFALTGSLYTWGIKGSYNEESYDIALQTPLTSDVDVLKALALSELSSKGLSKPEGKAKIKTIGQHFYLEWSGSSKDITLMPGPTEKKAILTIKHTSWYRTFVQLHKAKGGTAFKIFASLFAISLGLLLVSGFMMALQVPHLKKLALTSSLIGFASFLLVVLIS
ncbi:PepSY domain-containing protein [Alteromonas sediminis]|uniref:PepSY domain-containing protein n=1 Tax=Alteromonas sediminis TaxID=2259342 RepID=A0A3N5YME3_9ALTE|nr:PepSY domain-containing protein [Alteromonas sediminis]RPJ66531.1 PepSY domain-containing protein [Alteromonas sediminis]